MLRRRGLKPRNALVTIDIKVLTDLYRCIARDRPSRYVIMARETRSHARVACEGPRSTSEDTGTGGWLGIKLLFTGGKYQYPPLYRH